MSFDRLLDWVSESGSGSWEAFKLSHEWLRRAGFWHLQTGPSGAARTLATLAHMEVDWLNRSWAAAPAILTILPEAGAHALLCGSRTKELTRRLKYAVGETNRDIWPHAFEQQAAPRALFFQIASETVAQQLADDLGVRYEYSISARIAGLLPPLDSYLQIAVARPAPSGAEAEVFDVAQLTWGPAQRTDRPGAYRYKVYGAPEYRYITKGGSIHRMDRDLSIHAVLRDAGRKVLRWHAQQVNGDLYVAQGADLPLLHARAAALCTGLAPSFDSHARARRFMNVPLSIAETIARSLGQALEVVESHSAGSTVTRRLTRSQGRRS